MVIPGMDLPSDPTSEDKAESDSQTEPDITPVENESGAEPAEETTPDPTGVDPQPPQLATNSLTADSTPQKSSGESSDEPEAAGLELDATDDQDVFADRLEESARGLLWQPRYAVFGNQLYSEAVVTIAAATTAQSLELIEDVSGYALGLSTDFLVRLDQSVEQLDSQTTLKISDIPIALPTSSLLSVGYLVWLIRAGALVSTFISMPAWTQFDPLPVIEKGIPRKFGDDEDALEKLVDTVQE